MAFDRQELKRRKEREKAEVAAKVAGLPRVVPREGVVPLNPGFFAMENSRYARGDKKRAKRVKLREGR